MKRHLGNWRLYGMLTALSLVWLCAFALWDTSQASDTKARQIDELTAQLGRVTAQNERLIAAQEADDERDAIEAAEWQAYVQQVDARQQALMAWLTRQRLTPPRSVSTPIVIRRTTVAPAPAPDLPGNSEKGRK